MRHQLPTAPAPLTGPDVADLLGAAVAAMGGSLVTSSPAQVDHRPGRGTTVSYRATVRWPGGERTETLGARLSTGAPAQPDRPGLVTLSDGNRQVEVWRFPTDPCLPGLAAANDPRSVAELLRTVGLSPAGARVRTVAYRPCRRAVVEVTTPAARLFIKVLRRGRAAGVHRRLAMTRAAGLPTPRSLGWSDEGLVVLEPLPGLGLREAVHRHGSRAASPEELLRLLDRLPAELARLPRRLSWSESAGYYGRLVADSAPELADRALAVAADVEARADGADDDGRPVHGDFYEAQLLVSQGRISGLLDLDTAGPGRRVDDLACLVAHLSVLVSMTPAASSGARQALAEWTERFDRAADPHQLRVRAAGVALSLASGPYRTQEKRWRQATADRISLAERWLDAARRNDGSLPRFDPLAR